MTVTEEERRSRLAEVEAEIIILEAQLTIMREKRDEDNG